MFVHVKCRCGRTLRARRGPTRTTIRCWDCRAEVKVPRLRTRKGPGPVDQVRIVMASEWVEVTAAVALLALAVTAVIAVPRVGGWLALVVLIGVTLLYCRRIRVVGRGEAFTQGADERPSGPATRGARALGRLALATAFVAGFAAPLWVADGSTQRVHSEPIAPGPVLLAAGLAGWLVLPLVVFALVACDEGGRLGWRRALAAARRRRGLTLAALLLPPLAIAATEGTLVASLHAMDRLRTPVMDVFPIPRGHEVSNELIIREDRLVFVPRREVPRLYAGGLARGATLTGSVPISFRRGPRPRLDVATHGHFSSESYLLARLGITLAIMFMLFGSLALQAELLGRVARSAPPPDGREDEDEAAEEGPPSARGGALVASGPDPGPPGPAR